jgi:hypothetical protein
MLSSHESAALPDPVVGWAWDSIHCGAGGVNGTETPHDNQPGPDPGGNGVRAASRPKSWLASDWVADAGVADRSSPSIHRLG